MNRRRGAPVVLAVLLVFAGCLGGAVDAPDEPTNSPTDAIGAADGELSVHFIDVGHGNSVLVVGPTGETLLYDTGNWDDDGERVLDYLRARGVERIDYLVTSHAHADHVGGHAAVIDHYETRANGVGAVYDPGIAASSRTYEAYLDAVEEHDVTLYRAQAGDVIPMEGADVRVLAPPEGYIADRDRNENSLVLRVGYGNASVLLPGDAESQGERFLRQRYGGLLNATMLAAGHHGSNSSTGPAFLAATTPRVVAIQSAYDSPYGHPHREVLARLAERGIPTFWTAVHGTVVFETDGERAAIWTRRDAPTDPLELRSASPVPPGATGDLERRQTFRIGGGAVSAAGVDGPAGGLGGTVAPDGGTTTDDANATASAPDGGALAVAKVHADARGDEDANLDDEYVVFRNDDSERLDLSGWTVADEAGHTYTVPSGTALAPGETLTLRTGSGTDDDGQLYWNAGRPVWNNDGDTIFVRTHEGRLVLEESYDE